MNHLVTLDCVVKGQPKPHIVWFYNGERILRSDRMSIQHNGSIVIENVQESDAGKYTCQAENLHGKIKASALLEILGNHQ